MVNSLNNRLNKLDRKKSFPDYRPMTDEKLIHSLIEQAIKGGYYSGELPPEPPDVRSLPERLRDERRHKRLAIAFDSWGEEHPPCEKSEAELAREFYPMFEQMFSRLLSKEGSEQWELFKNIHNIDCG